MHSKKIVSFIDRVLKICVKPIFRDNNSPGNEGAETLFQWNATQLELSRHQMRINYTGEICAQALYAGHKNSTQSASTNQWLVAAQKEEYAHLQWCSQRLIELGSRPSRLDPLFYVGSFIMAKGLSCLSESYNIRFIRETEKQVQEHLEEQLPLLSHDNKSMEIVKQMILEEKQHHDEAKSRDDVAMPKVFSRIMSLCAHGMKYIVKYI